MSSGKLWRVISYKLIDVSEVLDVSRYQGEDDGGSAPETSANFYKTTLLNIQEESNLYTSRRENLKSYSGET
jgi:hypothetical protein